jgi:hypothetical protein
VITLMAERLIDLSTLVHTASTCARRTNSPAKSSPRRA